MARPQHQRRWRANTSRQRIEVYLPVDCVTALDALAAAREVSRATIIADLIGNTVPTADAPMTEAVLETEGVEQTTTATSDSVSAEASADSVGDYRFRRPRHLDEKRYQWIAETADGTRIALDPDPVRFYRWHGMVLDGSLYIKEAKGHSRDGVVAKLLQRI